MDELRPRPGGETTRRLARIDGDQAFHAVVGLKADLRQTDLFQAREPSDIPPIAYRFAKPRKSNAGSAASCGVNVFVVPMMRLAAA